MSAFDFGQPLEALRAALAVPVVMSPCREVAVVPGRRVARLGAVSGTALTVYRAKLCTGEEFHDAAQAAKRAAYAVCERWDLAADMSHHVVLPARYRSFRTPRGTRIRTSGDRRYPVARYWPGGELPPGVVPIADYARERAVERGVVPSSHWITYDGPALDLTPEVCEPEDSWAAAAE